MNVILRISAFDDVKSYMLWFEVFVNMKFRALYPDELETWLDHVTHVFSGGPPILF